MCVIKILGHALNSNGSYTHVVAKHWLEIIKHNYYVINIDILK